MTETKQMGDYKTIKQIGQGALGAVYLAEHRFMKKTFALKVLPEELCADRHFIQRFEEEVSSLAGLQHPHIVRVHNVSYDQGRYFLVTDCIVDEYGETTTLTQFLKERKGKFSESEVVMYLTQIAEALDYAHNLKGAGNGIAHRGIKPNNILISRSSGDDVHLYLSDYGLSRLIGTGNFLTRTMKMVAEMHHLTIDKYEGADVLGKAAPLHQSFLQSYYFLAPEQKIPGQEVTVSADTYAFGILAYYLLTARFPEGAFQPISTLRPEMQHNWDRLIISCLQPDPEKRAFNLLPLLEDIKKGEASQEKWHGGEALKPVLNQAEIEKPEVDLDPASAFQTTSSVKQYHPEKKAPPDVKPLLNEMVIIEGGTFYRGSNDGNRDEMPRHQVHLNSFAIDIHPVTNEQFVRFLELMEGTKDANHHDIIRLRDSRIKSRNGKFFVESGYLKHPVVGVTWYGAVGYAKWVGKRLPTEAEWEIAARGGIDDALYPTGEDVEKTQSNFFSFDTLAIQSYPPNGFGLYDMAGNVYEWCQDWYGYNYYEVSAQEPDNPKGPIQGVYRVLRGGCWKSLKEDLRCSRRHRNNPGAVNGTYGFRCAANVQPS